ncbi:hypothetical protein PHMEG_00010942, partial [Phytophthora megakarya]
FRAVAPLDLCLSATAFSSSKSATMMLYPRSAAFMSGDHPSLSSKSIEAPL